MSDDLVKRLRGPVTQAARDLIARYFGTSTKCLASIPARPDRDADLVLTAGIEEAADRIDALEQENKRLREVLQSIASNTCCDTCREAALVARAALAATQENKG